MTAFLYQRSSIIHLLAAPYLEASRGRACASRRALHLLRLSQLFEVIEQRPTIFWCNSSAPIGHFVEFPIPLCTGEALLKDQSLVVTDDTRGTKIRRRRDRRGHFSCGCGRIVDIACGIDVCACNDIPQIAGRIPFLDQGLDVSTCIPSTREHDVMTVAGRTPRKFPQSPTVFSRLTREIRRTPRSSLVHADIHCCDGPEVAGPSSTAHHNALTDFERLAVGWIRDHALDAKA